MKVSDVVLPIVVEPDWLLRAESDDSSETIFSLARSGHIQKLKNFLDSGHGVDINKKNHKGYSPLMLAVYNGNHEVSRMLLKSGADPNSSDLSGNTVLMGAAFKGDVEMVILLVNWGAKLDQRNHDGITAEQWAKAFGRSNVVSLLSTKANNTKFPNVILAAKVL